MRAALIFASAGLDSMVKQLVVDALPSIIDHDDGASRMFRNFIERRIRRGEGLDLTFLAGILADAQPRGQLIGALVRNLTDTSLQSTEQLLRAGSFFNIPSQDICRDAGRLSLIFEARNQIVHEMDVDFAQPNRNRRPRAKQKMIDFTNEIFLVASSFLQGVDAKLS